MSATNKALLNITKQDVNEGVQKSISPAHIPNVESKFKASFFFAIGVISALSLIGWATLDDASNPIQEEAFVTRSLTVAATLPLSPTQKVANQEISSIYKDKALEPIIIVKEPGTEDREQQSEKATISAVNYTSNTKEASVTPKKEAVIPKTPEEMESERFFVEEVELLPSDLAQKSRDVAKNALDRSDFKEAMKAYYTVLKYQPSDEASRKKLAALLYGKREVQESAAVLQQGIKLDHNSVSLRLALASLLQKEKQPEAALSVLEFIPVEAGVDYLATRGGLAQQLKLMDLAKESYQMLVNKEPDNGRWWLGLAIVYEREAQVKKAYETYQAALIKPGLSRSSQVFIRDRIKLLATMEGTE
ncbi:MSHA biogenesis protein MshN [Aliivibrio sp. S3MY1]|uniref:tetratricopeptide repeat protein n=1 Tax=unclassified Aliivibrio TaxID=2645654 RepID=UPI0023792414|nr:MULTISPECIES: MSHA biogenesis protein MshN [unclassified Aliivibrio]MDD9197092.1 MSHA biogenesis protein MshN [Aliivibrio sp. S3MY1]MDD9200237.1 MSHA biogenesis protein MshN [Aliivibrio sp. S2MY1]